MAVKTPATAAETTADAAVRFDPARAVAMGCNPQRAVRHAPDTPWGRLRAERGWSIRELADRSGLNRGDLSKFERGRGCPTPDQALRILRAFEMTS